MTIDKAITLRTNQDELLVNRSHRLVAEQFSLKGLIIN
jgi:hypothetical protein